MSDDMEGAWWGATLHAMECIIDCLPLETQKKIVERLLLVARIEEDRGMWVESYFSRALSGEKAPPPGEIAQPLGFDARVENMLTPDYDFRDALALQGESPQLRQQGPNPRGLFSAFLKPEDGIA